MAIETPDDLREHLQWALQVELSTIPTYLYAMYSIDDGTSDPYKLIRSIVVEEMLHMALVANVLTAAGGRPLFYDRSVLPSYPMALPHHEPELILNLERCTPDVIRRVFMTIERPRPVGGPPEDDRYRTIEQFYLAVERAVERLDANRGLFDTPRVDHQLADPGYYAPVEYDVEESGGLHAVEDLESAERAIETIIHQGEGLRDEHYADPNHHELTHYYKFEQIAEETYPLGETRPVLTNPKTVDLAPPLRDVSTLFNAAYAYLFVLLEALYSRTDREAQDRLVRELYAVMNGVLPPLARYLTDQPASPGADRHAGPTFEFYRFPDDAAPATRLAELCGPVVAEHPDLESVRGPIDGLEGPTG